MKSDKSKHNICIASIKRSTMSPHDFKWTKFYESNLDFSYSGLQLDLTEHELVICSTAIDDDNFSILTTQRLITREKGETVFGAIEGAKDNIYGDFKENHGEPFVFGEISLKNGIGQKYFIETGNASMVMIYGVRTLIGISP